MAEVKLWAVGSGEVKPWIKASRDAVKYIKGLDGFRGVHIVPNDGRTMWLFDTLNNAKIARNLMESQGIVCGKHIVDVFVDEKYLAEKGEE